MNLQEKLQLKRQLKDACIQLLHERILTAAEAMQLAQESANNSEKSSAGDKYETARSLGQLDRAMNARQMEEAERELAFLQGIDVEQLYESVTAGSVVHDQKNLFFVAVGLGQVTIDENTIFLLSTKAPLTMLMKGKKAGDRFSFNGKDFVISEVY